MRLDIMGFQLNATCVRSIVASRAWSTLGLVCMVTALFGVARAASADPVIGHVIVGQGQMAPNTEYRGAVGGDTLAVNATDLPGHYGSATYQQSPTTAQVPITLDCVAVNTDVGLPFGVTGVAQEMMASGTSSDGTRFYITVSVFDGNYDAFRVANVAGLDSGPSNPPLACGAPYQTYGDHLASGAFVIAQ